MTCWVVPAIAAEFWNVKVEEIMARIADGRLRCMQDNGFTFVDVGAPRLAPHERPATFQAVAESAVENTVDEDVSDEVLNYREAREASRMKRVKVAA